MIVSDFGSREEEIQGHALVGSVGNAVARYLWDNQDPNYRVQLDNCYRCCYIKQDIPEARSKSRKLREAALAAAYQKKDWRLLLKEEIEYIQPNVIIALGEQALSALTNNHGINKFRGSILPLDRYFKVKKTIKVIPTLHPREVWERWEMRVIVRIDYEKALKYQNDAKPIEEDYLIRVLKTHSGVRDYWERQKKKKDKHEFAVTDVETYGDLLTTVGFCFDGYEAVSVPLINFTATEYELCLIWKLVAEIIYAPWVRWVNQNIKFDWHQLARWGFRFYDHSIVGDTMLSAHTLYSELPKNLGFLNSIYTEIPYFKDEGKEFNPRIAKDSLYVYNAKDCLSTWRIHKEQQKELEEEGLKEFYDKRVIPMFYTYRKIERRGILVDEERKKKLVTKYTEYREAHQNILNGVYGQDINVNSPNQVADFVYNFLKCPQHTHKTPAGQTAYTTDEDTLEEIWVNEIGENDTRVRLLKTVIVVRKIDKILQFLKRKTHPDGRLRTIYRPEGTKTGRSSTSITTDRQFYTVRKEYKNGKVNEFVTWENYGVDFHNMPKHGFEVEDEVFGDDCFTIFVPTPGYCFVEGDLSGAEARVVSVLAEDWGALEMFNRKDFKRNEFGCKDDIHTITATWTTSRAFESITKFDREKFGKRPRHAGNYDQGPGGLARVIHRHPRECSAILRKFHDAAPNIRHIFHKAIRECVNNGEPLWTPYGRKRDFFGRRNDKLYKEAYAQIPQSTVSDHIKFSIDPIWDGHPDCFFVVEKHDSLMAEVPIDEREAFGETFQKIAERPISFREGSLVRDYDLVIPLELHWSDECWKKEMNPWT